MPANTASLRCLSDAVSSIVARKALSQRSPHISTLFPHPPPHLVNPSPPMAMPPPHSAHSTPTSPPAADKQSLCLDLLMRGYINSYVDLFYLTHRHDNQTTTAQNSSGSSCRPATSLLHHLCSVSTLVCHYLTHRAHPVIGATANYQASSPHASRVPTLSYPPSSSLPFLSLQLSTAEHYHRLAQPTPIFTAYTALSHYFTSA